MTISRRNLIKAGAAAGIVASMGAPGQGAADHHVVRTTTIPSSGQRVPAIGIGTVSFRDDRKAADMAVFRETLQTFHRMGGTLVDTSPNYGRSEVVLGKLMSDLAIEGELFLATKVDQNGEADGVKRMNQSFANLGSDHIDLMQVHNLVGTATQLNTMQAWKDEGRFRHIGITTHRNSLHQAIEEVMHRVPLDFIQINYSVTDRAAEARLLPLAMDMGIAVLVNRPFGRGQLFRSVRDTDLPDWAADINAESWAQVLLKFIIAHPAATIPIPGTSKPGHAADNMRVLHGPLPDPQLRKEMVHYFDGLV